MTKSCPLCGLSYAPGGGACRERGCPLATAACRSQHCPRCGYSTVDETTSVLARLVRRLFGARARKASRSLADLRPGELAKIDRLEGEPRLLVRLGAQGLYPGLLVRLLQRWPSLVLEAGETTFALDRRVAASVLIVPAPGC